VRHPAVCAEHRGDPAVVGRRRFPTRTAPSRRRRLVAAAAALAALLVALPLPGRSQEAPPAAIPDGLLAPDQFVRGTVVQVLEERQDDLAGLPQFAQVVLVALTTGPEAGNRVRAEYSTVPAAGQTRILQPGHAVVIARSVSREGFQYFVVDHYRLPPLAVILGLFLALAIALGRLKGLASLLGLGITVLVLVRFVVPQILAGSNPLMVSVLGALVIALVSIYLAHGFSRRTSVAVAGTLITLAMAAFLAVMFVSVARLFGVGSEEAFYLQLGPLEQLNLRGLLLGGIILGALGVLDDITTSQAAAVDEIHRANPALPVRELYRRGLSVGTEHIVSLVNTLFLAYAGASLPLFILFTINVDQPLWVIVNSEFVAEEVLRTLVGSIALIVAVPITTALAAHVLGRAPRS
jgi:uncharacterized membrane protein